jgi:hypothetical protein
LRIDGPFGNDQAALIKLASHAQRP